MDENRVDQQSLHGNNEFIEAGMNRLIKERVFQPVTAVNVANQVTYVNSKIISTSSELDDLVEGRSTKLGIQLALGDLKRTPDRTVYVRPNHTRSALITMHADIALDDGQIFSYLDVKGVGNLKQVKKELENDENRYMYHMKPIPTRSSNAPGRVDRFTYGAETERSLKRELVLEKRFNLMGVRTVPIVAATQLKKVVSPQGTIIDIEQAKDEDLLDKEIEPALIFRAWVTPYRMNEILYNPENNIAFGDSVPTLKDKDRMRAILDQAMVDMKQDPTIPQNVRDELPNVETYLKWIAQTVGINLGKLHNEGFVNGNITALHNITLDGRMVDFDTVRVMSSKKKLRMNTI